jgi:hypothetical protein
MTKITRSLVLLAAMTAGLSTSATSACPMCKESIPNDEGTGGAGGPGGNMGGPSSGLPSGFNSSVYLMLGGLFCTLGLVGFTLVRGIRDGGPGERGFDIKPKDDEPSAKK